MPSLSRCALALAFCLPLTAQVPLFQHHGPAANKAFARYVEAAGDIDRDGTMDYIVGTANANLGAGRAEVFSGRDGSRLFLFEGRPALKAQLGSNVSNAGDVNNDGYPDPIVGAYSDTRAGTQAGSIYVFSGKDGSVLHEILGRGPGDLFGTHVDGVGDIDGDGHADFIAGAPENADPVKNYGDGYARLYSGKTGALLHTFDGHNYGGEFGHVCIGVGDIDKDGTPDVMIGSTLEGNGRGSARVYSGRTKKLLYNFPAPFGGDHFGVVLAAGGDVDRDGYLDLIVGAPNPFSYLRGAVWVFSGRTGEKIHFIEGAAKSGMFGMSVMGLGDINGDGHADFAAGDPMDSAAGPRRGSFRGFSGKDGSPLFVLHGNGGDFGVAGACLGDLNGDGSPELVCGIPGAQRNGQTVGLLEILSLNPVATVGSGCAAGRAPRLDATVARVGDPCTVFLSSSPHAIGALFLSGLTQVPTAIAPGCYSHLDLASAQCLRSFRTDAGGRWAETLQIPSVGGLVGAQFALQSAVGRTAAPMGTDLSNGLHVMVR